MLGSLQKETGINTKIQLYIDPFRKEAFSMGILHPLIVLPANMDKDKLRLFFSMSSTYKKQRFTGKGSGIANSMHSLV